MFKYFIFLFFITILYAEDPIIINSPTITLSQLVALPALTNENIIQTKNISNTFLLDSITPNTTQQTNIVIDVPYLFKRGPLYVNDFTTVTLKYSNLISDRTNLILDGGTFIVNGKSDFIGKMTLEKTSTIDMSDKSVLRFSSLNYIGGNLIINNWSNGDIIQFKNTSLISQSFLDNIIFNGYGQGAVLNGNRIMYVPEPLVDIRIVVFLLMLFLYIKLKK